MHRLLKYHTMSRISIRYNWKRIFNDHWMPQRVADSKCRFVGHRVKIVHPAESRCFYANYEDYNRESTFKQRRANERFAEITRGEERRLILTLDQTANSGKHNEQKRRMKIWRGDDSSHVCEVVGACVSYSQSKMVHVDNFTTYYALARSILRCVLFLIIFNDYTRKSYRRTIAIRWLAFPAPRCIPQFVSRQPTVLAVWHKCRCLWLRERSSCSWWAVPLLIPLNAAVHSRLDGCRC